MSRIGYLLRNVCGNNCRIVRYASTKPSVQQDQDEEFRVLDLKKTSGGGMRRNKFDKKAQVFVERGRADSMATDQDWTSVWPAPRSFHPATVPLPVRQGINKLGAPPDKFGNAELMKIPNFLHLTPPAIDKHTEALKRFCTAWPQGLETDEKCAEHFPLEVTWSDYCHASPNIRDPKSRIVTIKVELGRLELDHHARDKLLRLVGERYDSTTDVLTITTDKCPLRQQNYDYALYLLTALYHESWVYEDWEKEKTVADMELYDWQISVSRYNVEQTLLRSDREFSLSDDRVQNYANATQLVFNQGENDYNWEKYSESSIELLFPQ